MDVLVTPTTYYIHVLSHHTGPQEYMKLLFVNLKSYLLLRLPPLFFPIRTTNSVHQKAAIQSGACL